MGRVDGTAETVRAASPLVIVIVDNLELRETTSLLLEARGFRALTVGATEFPTEALIREAKVAICDFAEEAVDSVAVSNLLASEWPSLPLIVVGNNRRTMRSSVATLPNVFALIEKPYDPAELCQLLWECCAEPDGGLARH